MKGRNVENLDVWKRGCRLAVNVCIANHGSKEFELKNQITRSAISIASNIAEGAERPSDAEFWRFLAYSKRSCGELRAQLMIHHEVCRELNMDRLKGTSEMIDETHEISKMLGSLMDKLSPDS